MKISLWSDLHMEFATSTPTWKNPGSDVLILGGDICVAEHLWRNPPARPGILQKDSNAHKAALYRDFFAHVSSEWPTVLYVLGNHEHYHGIWDRTADVMIDELAKHPNIHVMKNNSLELDGTVFLGTSLWTSFNNGDPITLMGIRDMMNDYRQITEKDGSNYHRLAPATTFKQHKRSVNWLVDQLASDTRPTVVVTHHAPSFRSIHPKYAGQTLLNSAFVSDLDWIMQQHDHIKLWTHGHVHDRFDYTVNQTRVVCNPHGYPGEQSGFDPNLIIEI